MGKWKRPEDQVESDLEKKFWYYFFRGIAIVGIIFGIINTLVNIVATLNGTMTDVDTHPLLFVPYSFIGGFALGSILFLWVFILLLGIYEILWFTLRIRKIIPVSH